MHGLLRRIWCVILSPKCKCRIEHKWPFIRSTIRECPVHGDKTLHRKLKSKYGSR